MFFWEMFPNYMSRKRLYSEFYYGQRLVIKCQVMGFQDRCIDIIRKGMKINHDLSHTWISIHLYTVPCYDISRTLYFHRDHVKHLLFSFNKGFPSNYAHITSSVLTHTCLINYNATYKICVNHL